jgi:hypothetical protein
MTEAWIDGRLPAGVTRTGPVRVTRERAWGTVRTAPTTGGPVWLKVPGPDTVFEVALYELLASVVPDRVPAPLAVDVPRGWLLLADGGPTLPDDDFAALGGMLNSYGALQRELASHVDSLLAVGLADMRPAAMPTRFDEALAIAERIGAPGDRSALDRIAGLRPVFDEWCTRLAESPVPASIDHNDLHPGNVFATGPLFYDWGDAVVAHPFASMLVALGFLHIRHGLAATDPMFVRMRDAYLEPFTDLAPRASLVADVELACQVGKVARALTWDRAVRAEGYAGKFGRAPLETLLALDADWFSLQA